MKYAVHDMEVMDLSPGRVELGMYSTSVEVVFEPRISITSASVSLRACACSPQTSKETWQYISFEVPDGSVVKASISRT